MTGDGTAQVRPVDANHADPGGDGSARSLARLFAFVAGVSVIGIGLATTYLGRDDVDDSPMAWGVRGGDAWLVLAGYAPYLFMLAAGVAAHVGRPRDGRTTGPAVHPLVAVPIAWAS